MLTRLLSLIVLATLTYPAIAAKPPDLPDDPPIVVTPAPRLPMRGQFVYPNPVPSLPPMAWREAPQGAEFDMTEPSDGDRLLTAALLFNAHPFVAFLPAQHPVTQGCPYQPCDNHVRTFADPAVTRTVMENLEALEKAAYRLGQAEELAKQGKYAEAKAALEEACKLVPGSSCAQRAGAMLRSVCVAQSSHPGASEEAEEASPPEGRFLGAFRQFGMCQVNGLCEKVKECEKNACCVEMALSRPITLHCVNTPLGVVLDNLRTVCGVNVMVDNKVCLQRPVCVHAQSTPARVVVEMVVRPMGYETCVTGGVVRVSTTKSCASAKGCSECCEDGRCDAKCCQGKKCCCEEVVCTKTGCCQKAGSCTDKKCCCEAASCAKSSCCEKGCCKEATGLKMCGGTTCPLCQAVRVAGVEEQVTGLLKACYQAIEEEHYEKAADLARQARALDPVRVEGDPVVYKFSLLGECTHYKPCPVSCPGACQPSNNYPAKNAIKVNVIKGVGVNSGAKLTGTVVVNRSCCDCCCNGSVFTKVVRTHGVELAKNGAALLTKLYVAEPIPDTSTQGCLTLGLSTSGVVNVYVRTPYKGTVYNATLKDGFFLMWAKPAESKTEE